MTQLEIQAQKFIETRAKPVARQDSENDLKLRQTNPNLYWSGYRVSGVVKGVAICERGQNEIARVRLS